MIVTPLARASASSLSILGMEATQRGRSSMLQNCLIISIAKSAVVLGSSVTGLSSGGGGTFMLDHSSMMVWAGAGAPQARATASAVSDSRWRNRNMFFLPNGFVIPKGTSKRARRQVRGEAGPSIAALRRATRTSLFDHLVGELLKM